MNFFKKNKIFIIGEIGLNHDGSKKKCKLLIKKASDAKFDAVKLQISIPEESYDKNTKSYKFFLKYNLSVNDLKEVKKYAKEKKIILFTTVGDIESIKYVRLLKSKIIKISSGLLTNYPLIKKLAQLNLPMIISSGLAFKKDVNEAVKLIRKYNKKQLGILVCTSIYPTNDKQVKINAISEFKKIFKKNFIGYSDHSMGIHVPLAAVSLGAQIIEKHVTLDRSMKGTDHPVSANTSEVRQMTHDIRTLERSFGKYDIFRDEACLPNVIKLSKSLATKISMKKGDKITLDKLHLLSPGDGLKWIESDLKKVINKTLNKDIDSNTIIRLNDIL